MIEKQNALCFCCIAKTLWEMRITRSMKMVVCDNRASAQEFVSELLVQYKRK